MLKPLRDNLENTRPEPDGRAWSRPTRRAPTLSRRGLFAFAGAGAGMLLLGNVGQSIGGPLRSLALLAPRREDFPVNKTRARRPA